MKFEQRGVCQKFSVNGKRRKETILIPGHLSLTENVSELVLVIIKIFFQKSLEIILSFYAQEIWRVPRVEAGRI